MRVFKLMEEDLLTGEKTFMIGFLTREDAVSWLHKHGYFLLFNDLREGFGAYSHEAIHNRQVIHIE